MVFEPPSNVQQDKAKWVEDIKQRYAKALYTMEIARNGSKAIDQNLANASLSPEERKKLEERKLQLQKQYSDAINFANLVRKQYSNQKTAQNSTAVPNAANQGRPQAVAGAGNGAANIAAATAAAANPMQSSAAAVNAAFEAAKKQQLAAGRMPGANAPPTQQGPAHPHQAQAQPPAISAQAQPSPIQTALAQPGMPQQQSQQPQQSQQAQQPPAPIKMEPGSHPLPTPLNTAIAANAAGMQSAGTPTQNSARIQTPQSATPTNVNANARPLTHAAAIEMASKQRAGAIPTAPAAGSKATPGSGFSAVGTAQQSGHPHAHPPQAQPATQINLQSKLPIPKVLPDKATQIPQPVPNIGGIGGGRPTYSGGGSIGGGVMNQPVLPKTPAYQLEGEGERVLNKKKLDELVRQVCGGTAEGQEGNMLTPEVEEVRASRSLLLRFAFYSQETQSVLNMADAFVDNVLHQACRNAKERGSKVLEIRDIQLVLERTYNIRVPGYSSDELRTVRKVQPNNSWIKKMSAVQAAKVVPGKGDL